MSRSCGPLHAFGHHDARRGLQSTAADAGAGKIARMLRVRTGCAIAALLAAIAAVPSAIAGPDKPLLSAAAFKAVPTCALVDPFADANPERAEHNWGCDADIPLTMAVRTPRIKATDAGPSAVELQVDRQVSLQAGLFTGAARVGMQAGTDPNESRLKPRRNLLAASGNFRLAPELALDLDVGRDVLPALRSRATATAVFRPEGRHVMYVQVAGEEGTPGRSAAVGMRWWIAPGSALLDVSARRLPDDSIEPRLGLRWTH
jgi:hypothetical protein